MATFTVEMTGVAREVYQVEADSEEEASANWASGHQVVLEASSMEVVSVTREEE